MESIRQLIKKIPIVSALIHTNAYKNFRYIVTLKKQERKNSNFTQFVRLPSQFKALVGPVIDYFVPVLNGRKLIIAVIGCSRGAEAYSISSFLKKYCPEFDFTVHAYDIDEEIIQNAKRGLFTSRNVFGNPLVDDEFVSHTFVKECECYRIRTEIMKHVIFRFADALDPDLPSIVGKVDIVFAQNFLYHLNPKSSCLALDNICRCLEGRGALFIDGMDPGRGRDRILRYHGFTPLNYLVEEIYNEAWKIRGSGWPYEYWGLEPYSSKRRNSLWRYATIFTK